MVTVEVVSRATVMCYKQLLRDSAEAVGRGHARGDTLKQIFHSARALQLDVMENK